MRARTQTAEVPMLDGLRRFTARLAAAGLTLFIFSYLCAAHFHAGDAALTVDDDDIYSSPMP